MSSCIGLCTLTHAAAEELPSGYMDAMDNTSTWGHPDQANEFAGLHQLDKGHYAAAMQRFLEAARYADKLAQLSIGLMYANGQGVSKDPVRAFAWVAIAAERKYPAYLATRDELWAKLDAAQREQARQVVTQLYADYGDVYAKPRMEYALREALKQKTGSYLGGSSGNVTVASVRTQTARCGQVTIAGAPARDCDGVWSPERWDPKLYFASQDAIWGGHATVGQLQQADAGGRSIRAAGDKP